MVYRTEATRESILSVALELFLNKGLYETQMTDVADAVGISRSSLYRYYRDKLDLASAILEQVFEDQAARLEKAMAEEEGSGLDRLRAYLLFVCSSPSLRKQNLFIAEYDNFFSGERLTSEFRTTMFKTIRGRPGKEVQDLIEAGQADGSIRSDLDSHLAMVTVFNAMRGFQQRILLRGKALVEVKKGELQAMPLTMVELLIDALCARDSNRARDSSTMRAGRSSSKAGSASPKARKG
jgi:Transcriptional regulator